MLRDWIIKAPQSGLYLAIIKDTLYMTKDINKAYIYTPRADAERILVYLKKNHKNLINCIVVSKDDEIKLHNKVGA